MQGWKEIKLKDAPIEIIDGDRGIHYPKSEEFTKSGHCLFLSAKNVTANGLSFSELNFIPEERHTLLRKGKLERKDVILTTRGTVGNIGYYTETIPYSVVRINSGMVIIRPKGIDPDYNHQLFKYLRKDFSEFASGSAQPQLPIRDLIEIPILLPPLPEQKAIASVLSSLDDKIDLLHRQNKTLEAMAETLFRQWFVEEADESWEEVTLGYFADNIRDNINTASLSDFDTYIGLEHIPRRRIYIDNTGQTDTLESNKSRFSYHDILFGKLRSYFHKVSFAPTHGVCSTDILVIRPKSKELFPFCLFWFFSDEVVAHSDAGAEGTRMPRSNWGIISNYKVPKPDNPTIERFNNVAIPAIKKIEDNASQIKTLEKLRDTLLPKLMSGEVRVKV